MTVHCLATDAVVSLRGLCLADVQTMLEHAMREFRPGQRSLQRLTALPGEENRTGFNGMITVSVLCGNAETCCKAHPVMQRASLPATTGADCIRDSLQLQYLEEKGRAGVIDLPPGTRASVGGGAPRRAYLIPPSRAICDVFGVLWDPPEMLLVLVVPVA